MRNSRLAGVVIVVCFLGLCARSATGTGEAAACHVRNITQGTAGSTLRPMVRAARDGDRLWLRGRCVGGVIIGKDLTITGRGGESVVTGLDRHRVFRVREGATVTLRQLDLAHGVGVYDGTRGGGGGVYNEGTVVLVDSVVRRAIAGEDPGGAIANFGTMTIRDSVVRRSRADWGGGIGNMGTLAVVRSRVVANLTEGIWSRGVMTISDSVVDGNAWGGIDLIGKAEVAIHGSRITDNRRGGGITKSGGGTLTLDSSVISGNTSSKDGGGIAAHWGQLVLVATTITANTAARHGGGIFVEDGTTSVTLDATSSVSGNTPDDCYGTSAC